MHFFNSVLSLALFAGSVLAQSTQFTYPPPGSKVTAGSDITVQVGMEPYPENIDVVAIVIGLVPCQGDTSDQCPHASSSTGNVLYQGPYNPQPGNSYANYSVKIPESFAAGIATLNVVNLFMVGEVSVPTVNYLSSDVKVVAHQ